MEIIKNYFKIRIKLTLLNKYLELQTIKAQFKMLHNYNNKKTYNIYLRI